MLLETDVTVDVDAMRAPAEGQRPMTTLTQAVATGELGRPRGQLPMWLLGLIGVVAFLLLWQFLPLTGLVSRNYLPPFSEVVVTLGGMLGQPAFWLAFGQTLQGWALGLAISFVIGTVLGIVIGSVPYLQEITNSTIEFLRPIPSVAIIPLCVLILGTSPQSTLVLVVWAGVWPILVQLLYGIRDVDPVARETSRSYRFRTMTMVRTVTWPTALPYLMTGIRLAAAITLVLETTGELIIGSPGLGNMLDKARSGGNVPQAFALVLVIGLVAVAVNLLARAAERRLLRWHPSIRTEAA